MEEPEGIVLTEGMVNHHMLEGMVVKGLDMAMEAVDPARALEA